MSVKLYQNVLDFSTTAENFLTIDCAGCSAEVPEGFWRSLVDSPENVQSYLACLVARLISLDSRHAGMRPLSDVYKELCMTGDDQRSFKNWITKDGQWDKHRKHLSLYLQHAIVSTIYHLKMFYGYVPHPSVKSMYTLWNIARGPEGINAADEFEVKVLSDFGVLSKNNSSFGRWFYDIMEDKEELIRQAKELVDFCTTGHSEPNTGKFDLNDLSLCDYVSVAKSLDYYRLLDLIKHSPYLVDVTTERIMEKLEKAAKSNDVEEHESFILPLLQLFKSIAPMSSNLDMARTYESLMPLYLWPQPFACETQKVLEFLQADRQVKGSTFRQTVLMEQNLAASKKDSKEQHTLLIIDKAKGVCRSSAFAKAFETYSRNDPSRVKVMILKQIFKAVGEWNELELEGLERQLNENKESLDEVFKQAISILEMSKGSSEGFNVTEELKKIYSQSLDKDDSTEDRQCSSENGVFEQLTSSHYPVLPLQIECIDSQTPDALKSTLKKYFEVVNASTSRIKRASNTIGRKSRPKSKIQTSPDPRAESPSANDELVSDNLEQLVENGWVRSGSGGRRASDVLKSPIQTTISQRLAIDQDGQHSPSSSPSMDFDGSDFTDSNSFLDTSRRSKSLVSPTPPMFPNNQGKSASPARTRGKTFSTTATLAKHSSSRRSGTSSSTTSVVRQVKIAVAGNDKTMTRLAQAYAQLQLEEGFQFSHLELQFFYIPLSVATSTVAKMEILTRGKKENGLPEYMSEGSQNTLLGDDVWLSCYLAKFDSWYERNVLLAVHNTLRVIPAHDETQFTKKGFNKRKGSSLVVNPFGGGSKKVPPSPSEILRDITNNYCRNADSLTKLQLYKAEIYVKEDKAPVKHIHYFMQRLDLQKTQKKTRTSKPFEALVIVEEMALDESRIPTQMIKASNLWSVRAASVPRPEDDSLASPEAEGLELRLVKGQKTITEQMNFHVCKFIIESTKDKPFSVLLDSDYDNIIDNVVRMEVEAAKLPRLTQSPSGSLSATGANVQEKERLHFPLMTFWPLGLHSN